MWMYWWSPVASANRLTRSWVISSQSLTPSSCPTSAFSSSRVEMERFGVFVAADSAVIFASCQRAAHAPTQYGVSERRSSLRALRLTVVDEDGHVEVAHDGRDAVDLGHLCAPGVGIHGLSRRARFPDVEAAQLRAFLAVEICFGVQ